MSVTQTVQIPSGSGQTVLAAAPPFAGATVSVSLTNPGLQPVPLRVLVVSTSSTPVQQTLAPGATIIPAGLQSLALTAGQAVVIIADTPDASAPLQATVVTS